MWWKLKTEQQIPVTLGKQKPRVQRMPAKKLLAVLCTEGDSTGRPRAPRAPDGSALRGQAATALTDRCVHRAQRQLLVENAAPGEVRGGTTRHRRALPARPAASRPRRVSAERTPGTFTPFSPCVTLGLQGENGYGFWPGARRRHTCVVASCGGWECPGVRFCPPKPL